MSDSNQDNLNVCYSGGAEGADLEWKVYAKQAGHTTIDVLPKGKPASNGTPADKNLEIQGHHSLRADAHLKLANRYLKRRYPTASTFVNNLLRRNYFIITNVDRVYAVGWLNGNPENTKTALRDIDGGTAWGCRLYITHRFNEMRHSELYFYDQTTRRWWEYKLGDTWKAIENLPPKPSGRYAGIGSRKIEEWGIDAIEELYNQKNEKISEEDLN